MNAKPQVSPHLDKACYPEPNVVTESGGRLRAFSPVEGSPLSRQHGESCYAASSHNMSDAEWDAYCDVVLYRADNHARGMTAWEWFWFKAMDVLSFALLLVMWAFMFIGVYAVGHWLGAR